MEVTPSTLSTVVQTGGGRFVKLTGGSWEPQYCCTDHRGDIRVVYRANSTTGTAEVVQEDHLTPFGVQMVGMGRTNWPENQYRYQGKELNTTGFDTNGDNITDSRLYQYDFGARQYDPLIGRWHSADPENQYSSPYVAMGNNWISTIDPDGKWAIFRWISNFLSGISWSGSNDYEDTYYYEGFGWARAEGLAYCGFTPDEIAQKMETGNGNNGTSGSMSGSGGGGGGGGRTSSDKNKKKADGKGSGGSEKQKSSGDRPDVGGKLPTFGEVVAWYKWGMGQPLNVDINNIDVGDLSLSDFRNPDFFIMENGVNYPGVYVRFDQEDYVNVDQALILGTVGFVLMADNNIMARSDCYDFDLKCYSTTFLRDIGTLGGIWVNGYGNSFEIHFYGSKKIK
jgi:RHS repeat-associated protein